MLPWAYPWVMAASLATGLVLGSRSRRGLPVAPWERLGLAFGAFCGGMIGAKLPFLLADPEGLASGRAVFDGGKTILFGLVGGYLGVELAKWTLRVRVKTGDRFAIPVAAAIGVGRLACFCGGCCFGKPTDLPWGLDFGDGLHRHPTQIYEAAFHLTAAVVLALMIQHLRTSESPHSWLRGHLIKIYILAYLCYWFLTEFIRPEPVLAYRLTGYQWVALVLIVGFGSLWRREARSRSRSPIANRDDLPPDGLRGSTHDRAGSGKDDNLNYQ